MAFLKNIGNTINAHIGQTQNSDTELQTLNVGKSKGVMLNDTKDMNELQRAHPNAGGEITREKFVMIKNPKAETGHGPQSSGAAATGVGAQTAPQKTPEQLEREAAMEDFNQLKKERAEVINTNKDINKGNKAIDDKVAFLEGAKTHLNELTLTWDLDGSFTAHELNDHAGNMVNAGLRAAARWLKGLTAEQLSMLGLEKGPNGYRKSDMQSALGSLDRKITEFKNQKQELLEVPPEPVRPTFQQSRTPPPTQAPPPAGTPPPGAGTTPPPTGTAPGTAPTTPPATAPKETKEQLEARVFENYGKLGPFTTDAATSEGRLEAGANYIQKGLDALNDDLVKATLSGNQGEIMMVQNKIQKMQAGLSALMQMMKQQQEMLSNMSKMFNEMAMSSIRNMR
jgi:hypothetical protein